VSLATYLLRRLVAGLAVVAIVSVLGSALLEWAPGGLEGTLGADPRISGTDRENLRRAAGLQAPWPVRYGLWLRGLARLEFGDSLVTGQPVSAMIVERLPATLELMVSSIALAILVAFLLGGLCALRAGRGLDRALSGLSLGAMSLPSFWLGLLAILFFAVQLQWFPAGGRTSPGGAGGWADHLWHLVLPAGVLAAGAGARWSRYVRSSMRESLGSQAWKTASSRGLPFPLLLWRYGLLPSLPPVVTVIALEAPALFAGALITETVFGWPGVGRLFQDGLERRDEPRLMAILLLTSALIVSFNLAGEMIHRYLDPRVRIGGTA
jgi:peptide/nickel transport system permease protein